MTFSEREDLLHSDPAAPPLVANHREHGERRARRRARGLLRLDIAIGVLVAVIAILVAPGIAVVAIVAGVVLLVCGVSLLVGRARRGRRHPRSAGALMRRLGRR